MSKSVEKVKSSICAAVDAAFKRAMTEGALPEAEIPEYTLEVPGDRSHGDYAVNAALVSARTFHMAPRKIAEAVTERLDLSGVAVDRFEIAGAGFINFFLSQRFYADVLCEIAADGEKYGQSGYGKGERVLIEFVSANPTGPMHIGNARGGALGDCLASVMNAAGYAASREFYVNDAGNQIEKFATSLEVRYLQLYKEGVELPEDAYHGADITEHAKNFAALNGDKFVDVPSEERRHALVDYALPLNIAGLERDLKNYRIVYDRWFRESSLHADGSVKKVIDKLKESGYTYENEGALWFKATELGCEKDFVLVRSNGIPTYIVPDIAYHYDKLVTRGFDRAIDILGADHHGYVPRMRASLTALGVDAGRLEVILMQMVRLIRNGEVAKLSKRSGKAITLVTLLEDIPIDAARFFFNTREANSHFEFDLDLAIEQSSQNPVYYVQYAHARICSILKNLAAEGIKPEALTVDDFMCLTAPEERELISHLASLGEVIIDCAKTTDPTPLTRYASTLAALFHRFYNACRVKGDDQKLTQARLNLCLASRTVLRNVFALMKIDAPETM